MKTHTEIAIEIGLLPFDEEDIEWDLNEATLKAFVDAVNSQNSEAVAWMSSSGSVVGKAYKIRRIEDEMSDSWWNTHFKDYTIPLFTSPQPIQNSEPLKYMVQRFSEGLHEKDEYFDTKESAYENARWGFNETKVTPLFTSPQPNQSEYVKRLEDALWRFINNSSIQTNQPYECEHAEQVLASKGAT
jgi:hypothetical protein